MRAPRRLALPAVAACGLLAAGALTLAAAPSRAAASGRAVRRPAVDVRADPLRRLDAAARPPLRHLRRALDHRRPGRRAEPVAPRPDRHRRSRSTIRSSSRSRIPSLWNYPWIYIVEPGNLRLKETEVPNLREFLLRGGTLTFDDFHGPIEWDNLEQRDEAGLPRSQDRRAAARAIRSSTASTRSTPIRRRRASARSCRGAPGRRAASRRSCAPSRTTTAARWC